MWALSLCSIVSFAIILERLISLKRSRIIRIDLLMKIELVLKSGDLKEALEWCKRVNSPMMRVTKVALLNSGKPKDELKNAVEEAGRLEVPVLEKFLILLNTIAVISPLLGLLGTVTGMIQVFSDIQAKGVSNINNLAGGISEALLTTAAGMSIAIPTFVFYTLFSIKVENLINEMERHSLTMYDLLIRSQT